MVKKRDFLWSSPPDFYLAYAHVTRGRQNLCKVIKSTPKTSAAQNSSLSLASPSQPISARH